MMGPKINPSISDRHARMLGAAISEDVTAERGTFSARTGRNVPQDCGQLPRKSGMVFPVHTLDGNILYRLRLDKPGKLPKYMQPKGASNRLDVHPRQHDRIKRPGGMRFVTEGEKKTDAGVSRDLLMVGMSGVWNGQKDGELIPDWEFLPLEGEDYSICFDSDIESNPNVQMAAERQARLLRARGAKVFITLLPPAPDGSKQGLDDFFANGGTPRELRMLTRPYDPKAVERARLSRSERLRLTVADLERRFWATDWKGMGGHSDRDVALKLVEAARRSGKLVAEGLRVTVSHGTLCDRAKVSSRTLCKALDRLEERGFARRDNEKRDPKKPGAFVLRANVKHNGDGGRGRDRSGGREVVEVPCALHLRAPRLRWSDHGRKVRRGLFKGTTRVRETVVPARPPRKRLGKIRGGILDALDAAGGALYLQELYDVLNPDKPPEKKRPRDLRRRQLPMLEEEGIITVSDDGVVALVADWLGKLEEAREIGGEVDADRNAARRLQLKRTAYHNAHKTKSDHHWANVGADGFIEDLRSADEPERQPEPEPEVSALAAAVRGYLDRNPQDACQPPGWIGSTLWAYDLYPGNPSAGEIRAAIEELGGTPYLRRMLSEEGAA